MNNTYSGPIQYVTGAYLSHHVNLGFEVTQEGYTDYGLELVVDLYSSTDDVWPDVESPGVSTVGWFYDGNNYEYSEHTTHLDKSRTYSEVLAPNKWNVSFAGYLWKTDDFDTEEGCIINAELVLKLDDNGKLVIDEEESDIGELELGWSSIIEFSKPSSGVDEEAVNALIDARFNNSNGTLTPNDDHLKFDDKVTSPVTSATLDDNGYYNVTYAPGTGVGSTS